MVSFRTLSTTPKKEKKTPILFCKEQDGVPQRVHVVHWGDDEAQRAVQETRKVQNSTTAIPGCVAEDDVERRDAEVKGTPLVKVKQGCGRRMVVM